MTLTIFTPAYNRAPKLIRLYESLKAQNIFDFEWLIIDDGSTDDTEETVKSFLNETSFSVRYHKQPNGGKHRAYNSALKLARGDYFFCVDSDDMLAENAVESIVQAVKKIKNNQFVVAYKTDIKGNLLSDEFPSGVDITKITTLKAEYGCSGEFSLVFPKKLAAEYPFPEFEGEKFITESVVYDRIDKVAQAVLLPCVLTVCEYQPEGLTSNINSIMKKNPAGYCLYFMQRIDMQKSLKDRLIMAGKYKCFCILSGKMQTKYKGDHKFTVKASTVLGPAFLVYYKLIRGF